MVAQVGNKKAIPDFKLSMKAAPAQAMYEDFKGAVSAELGDPGRVKDGIFGAMMDVALTNDGPVTLIVDSPSLTDGGAYM